MFGNWGLTNPGNPTDRSAIYASVKRHQGPLPFPPLYTPPPPADDDAPTPENPFSKGVPEDQSFYRFFQQIRRITDVTPAHFDALNISIQQNLPLDQVVEQRFIPVDDALPTDPAAEAAAAEPRTAEQRERDRWAPPPVEPKEVKDQREWLERCRECLIDNDTAFQAVARIRRDVKLGHMYRFYQTLELVDPYYDLTPLPEKSPDAAAGEKDVPPNGNGKRPASPDDMDIEEDEDEDVEMVDAAAAAAAGGAGEGAAKEGEDKAEGSKAPKKDRSKEKWNMPERFREDLMKAFVEPLCWNHMVRIYPPRAPPKLALQASLFSIHLSDYIHRPSPIPMEARKGLVAGPVLGTQIRHEHLFRALSDPTALLLKRRKKLLASAKPSAAKKPRSAPSSSRSSSKKREEDKSSAAKELADDATDDLAPDEGLLTLDGKDVIGAAREVGAILHLAQMRNNLQGEGKDKKLRLCAIGRQPGKSYDDVYLITGLHHHIAVSHATVSDRYLRFLQTGRTTPSRKNPPTVPDEKGWERLNIRKSRYYDLMVPEDRKEAARAVVAVLRALSYTEEEKVKLETKAKAKEVEAVKEPESEAVAERVNNKEAAGVEKVVPLVPAEEKAKEAVEEAEGGRKVELRA